jgi:hypothetical protein
MTAGEGINHDDSIVIMTTQVSVHRDGDRSERNSERGFGEHGWKVGSDGRVCSARNWRQE